MTDFKDLQAKLKERQCYEQGELDIAEAHRELLDAITRTVKTHDSSTSITISGTEWHFKVPFSDAENLIAAKLCELSKDIDSRIAKLNL